MIIYKLFSSKGEHVASVYTKPSNDAMRQYGAVRFELFHMEQKKPQKYKAPECMLHF